MLVPSTQHRYPRYLHCHLEVVFEWKVLKLVRHWEKEETLGEVSSLRIVADALTLLYLSN